MAQPEYLGDGLYVVWDGWQLELRANDIENPTDRVYLDPSTLSNFLFYLKEHDIVKKEALQ